MESNQDTLYNKLNIRRLGSTLIPKVVIPKNCLFPPTVAHTCWFKILKKFIFTYFITASSGNNDKRDQFTSDMTVLFTLYSLFSSHTKEPYTYFRIVMTSLLYNDNAFRFLLKSGKLFLPNRLKASLEIRRLKQKRFK